MTNPQNLKFLDNILIPTRRAVLDQATDTAIIQASRIMLAEQPDTIPRIVDQLIQIGRGLYRRPVVSDPYANRFTPPGPTTVGLGFGSWFFSVHRRWSLPLSTGDQRSIGRR